MIFSLINFIILNIFFYVSPVLSGRTTTKYTSLPGGGFHHHGGFLGGYFDFYKGSRVNPADSFSEKYEEEAEDIPNYVPNDAEEEYGDILTYGVDEDYKLYLYQINLNKY